MIYIVSEVSTNTGSREEVRTHFKELQPSVLAEDGCLEYVATWDAIEAPKFQKINGAEKLIILERWRDMAAFRAHVRAPHMAAYAEKTKGLIVERAVSILQLA